MKKTLLAVALVASLGSGCSMLNKSDTVNYDALRKDGAELMTKANAEGYQPSNVKQLEVVRFTVNTAFLAAKPTYERYIDELKSTPVLGNYFAATEAVETEEEKRAIYDALPADQKKVVDNFMKSSMSEEMMSGLGEAAKVALENSSHFLALDSTDMLSGIDFTQLLTEKENVSFTIDQISYLNATVISAYNNYKTVSAFSRAG
ncbi:hypothetical protein ABT56_05755 [Photobacterium aquae]|uniref:Lipoprotein n=1 Tax=Photobacterium aquae TaxID=1195763 RepID=A0A0J1H5V5_9GAMM|nr:hypothetical protein [Photobacterium aquae]KLV07066.1 hypothetical protein ABT56_05755 [Photobacterium aquae]